MVVWQGITEGGTAVPVKVTDDGEVISKGIPGERGPAGPEGPEGPPGPAGVEWPPNPIEGAFLVWLNGEPTWYVEQPIPTPPGVAGPITDVSDNSLLTFGSNLDTSIFFTGVYVYAVNADGSNWDGDGQYDSSQEWSKVITHTYDQGGGDIENTFNGLTTEGGGASSTTSTTFPSSTLTLEGFDFSNSTVTVYYAYNVTRSSIASVGAGNKSSSSPPPGSDSQPYNNITFTGVTGTTVTLTATHKTGAGSANYITAIAVDGKILLDPLSGVYPTGQISSVANNSALLSRVQGTWDEGLYMKADAGTQAAWLYASRKKKDRLERRG